VQATVPVDDRPIGFRLGRSVKRDPGCGTESSSAWAPLPPLRS